jgi:hypothetical protein
MADAQMLRCFRDDAGGLSPKVIIKERKEKNIHVRIVQEVDVVCRAVACEGG